MRGGHDESRGRQLIEERRIVGRQCVHAVGENDKRGWQGGRHS
jgi:hypothetical protein